MRKLSFSQEVAIPAGGVWDIIGDFGGLSKWATRVKSERIEDRPEGTYRIITDQNGKIYQERLVRSGDACYTYSVERTGADYYETTIAVESLGEDKATILLTVEFEPKVDVDADALSEDISAFFRGCLKAMTKALNSSLPTLSIDGCREYPSNG